MIDWGYIISLAKVEIGQESIAFHIQEWWIVHNGPRKQIVTMFNNDISIDVDEIIAWKTIRRAFCNWNNTKDIKY